MLAISGSIWVGLTGKVDPLISIDKFPIFVLWPSWGTISFSRLIINVGNGFTSTFDNVDNL